jgi:hypothetical protein
MAKLGEYIQSKIFVENSVESVKTCDNKGYDNFLHKLKVVPKNCSPADDR